MGTPTVQVLVNESRKDLKQPGYAVSRTAGALRRAVLGWGPKDSKPKEFEQKYIPCDWGQEFKILPEYGVLMLRPNTERDDFMEDPDWADYWIFKSQLRLAKDDNPALEDDFLEQVLTDLPCQPRTLLLQRPIPATTPLVGLTYAAMTNDLKGLFDQVLDPNGMLFIAQTKALDSFTGMLEMNEAFSVWVRTLGLDTDRASAFWGIAFGIDWYLQLGMNGQAALYEQVKTQADPIWVRRTRFEYAQGGIDQKEPFQITVIPWGPDAITFEFSQAAQGASPPKSGYSSRNTSSFTWKRSMAGSDPVGRYDVARRQHVKTKPGPLTICVQAASLMVNFSIARVRYRTAQFALLPEYIDEPKPAIPASYILYAPVGYFGQRKGISGAGADASGTFVNHLNATWTPATDTRIVLKGTVTPDPWGIYTPEIWSVDLDIPSTQFTPTVTARDWSENWSKIAWSETVRPEPGRLRIKTERTDEWTRILEPVANIGITVDSERCFEGYVPGNSPATEGTIGPLQVPADPPADDNLPFWTQVIQDQVVAEDHWHRLNTTSAGHTRSMTKKSIGAIFESGLGRAGYDATQWDIAPELYKITVDGYLLETNDEKVSHESSSVGDQFRGLIRTYSLQGNAAIRILWHRGKWRGYLAPEYDDTVLPEVVFFLHPDALPASLAHKTDAERWAGVDGKRWFQIHESVDFGVRNPEFNSLRAYGSTGSGEPAEALMCAIAPKPDELTDSSKFGFRGACRPKEIGPPDTGLCSTINELQRFARRFYDEEYRGLASMNLIGEWQPVVEADVGMRYLRPDQFVWIIGLSPFKVESLGIYAGDPVSFGAWRIEQLDPEITEDQGPGNPYELEFTRRANYALTYVGEAVGADHPMFTDKLPA